MNNRQWNHGFNVGHNKGYEQGFGEGYEYGNESGEATAGWHEAERINILIDTLSRMLTTADGYNIPTEQLVVLQMISELNAKRMFNSQRAWHVRISRKQMEDIK